TNAAGKLPNAHASYSNFTTWHSPGAIITLTFDYVNAYIQYKDTVTFDMPPGTLFATAQGVCSQNSITAAVAVLRQSLQCTLHISIVGYQGVIDTKSYITRIFSLST